MGAGLIDASVLIRTKDESEHIGSTLEAVLSQQPAPKEVLVLDSGSSDGTLAIVESFPVEIVEIDPADWSYPGALNLGALKTSGSLIVCLSAHCVPTSTRWLESLTRHFEDPQVAGVWGPSVAPGRDFDPDEQAIRQPPGSYEYATRWWGLDNANSAVRRDLWEEFPFNEDLPAAEDKAWGMEAMSRGFDIVFEPAAAVYHDTHGFRVSYRRAYAIAEGLNQLFPEQTRHSAGGLAKVGRAATKTVHRQVRSPSLASMRIDVERGISSVANLLGLYRGSKEKRQ